jgi:chromosome segregation ATPase
MKRLWVVLALLLASTAAVAQTTDSQTLRAILEEIRQLRHDLQTTSVAAQRVQIALYRVQLQDAAVARASRVVDDAHERLANIRAERQRIAEQAQRFDDDSSQDAARRREIDEVKKQLKLESDRLAKEEEQGQARASDAEAQLRSEQNKLDSLHDVLDQLDQALTKVGRSDSRQ